MKKLFVLIIFSSCISAQVDWSNPNACELPNQSDLTNRILKNINLGQFLMGEEVFQIKIKIAPFKTGKILVKIIMKHLRS